MGTSKKSRMDNSLKNTKVSLYFYFLILATTFFSRKAFIDILGIELLGLNTAITNLLAFLNLTELGIGTAVSFALYKPLFDHDKKSIQEIISVQGWLYKNIALLITAIGIILMLLFPFILKKLDLPIWYAYATFITFLFSSLLGYFVNYKQIILSADQKQYKLTLITKGLMLLKLAGQIGVLYLSPWGYHAWLAIEVAFSILTALALEWVVYRNYPWLKTSFKLGKDTYKKYSTILSNTKQLFFHRMSGFILNQTSPLIIYAYTTLTLVAIYGNYMLIVSGIISLLTSVFSGIIPGIGNLIAEGNKDSVRRVFREYFACRMLAAAAVSYCLWISGNAFVSLWVGKDYILNDFAFSLIVIITFLNITRVCDDFLMAYGLFKDIWAPIAEAITNLGLSILLGYFFSLRGILSGVLISLVLFLLIWKPYFLHRHGLCIPVIGYYIRYMGYILSFATSAWATCTLLGRINPDAVFSWQDWILLSAQHLIIFTSISYLILFAWDKGIRYFSNRIVKRIKRI